MKPKRKKTILPVVVLDFSLQAGLPFAVVAPQSFRGAPLPDNKSVFKLWQYDISWNWMEATLLFSHVTTTNQHVLDGISCDQTKENVETKGNRDTMLNVIYQIQNLWCVLWRIKSEIAVIIILGSQI